MYRAFHEKKSLTNSPKTQIAPNDKKIAETNKKASDRNLPEIDKYNHNQYATNF